MHIIFRSLACVVARVIRLRQSWIDKFRHVDFKGKLLISSYMHLPENGGVYNCGGVAFDLDFSDGIQKEIFWGTYERHEKAFLERQVRQGWTCVDIGANVGFYTINLAHLIGTTGRVHAIEADPSNFKHLRRNVAINALQNVDIYNAAITSKDGPVEFFRSPDTNSGWGRVGRFEGAAGKCVVEGMTFDSFLSKANIDVVDFLKVDIEGHELSFLEGARKAFAERRIKRLLIEFCGYDLEPKGIFLKEYALAIESHGMSPATMQLDKLVAARNGKYAAKGEAVNLFFESNA